MKVSFFNSSLSSTANISQISKIKHSFNSLETVRENSTFEVRVPKGALVDRTRLHIGSEAQDGFQYQVLETDNKTHPFALEILLNKKGISSLRAEDPQYPVSVWQPEKSELRPLTYTKRYSPGQPQDKILVQVASQKWIEVQASYTTASLRVSGNIHDSEDLEWINSNAPIDLSSGCSKLNLPYYRRLSISNLHSLEWSPRLCPESGRHYLYEPKSNQYVFLSPGKNHFPAKKFCMLMRLPDSGFRLISEDEFKRVNKLSISALNVFKTIGHSKSNKFSILINPLSFGLINNQTHQCKVINSFFPVSSRDRLYMGNCTGLVGNNQHPVIRDDRFLAFYMQNIGGTLILNPVNRTDINNSHQYDIVVRKEVKSDNKSDDTEYTYSAFKPDLISRPFNPRALLGACGGDEIGLLDGDQFISLFNVSSIDKNIYLQPTQVVFSMLSRSFNSQFPTTP